MIWPLCLMLDVEVKSQLAARVRVIPALVTKGYSLRGMCFVDNGVSTHVATVSSAVAGAVELHQQATGSVPLQLEPLNERLEFWEL